MIGMPYKQFRSLFFKMINDLKEDLNKPMNAVKNSIQYTDDKSTTYERNSANSKEILEKR
jgi:hypothetical protein